MDENNADQSNAGIQPQTDAAQGIEAPAVVSGEVGTAAAGEPVGTAAAEQPNASLPQSAMDVQANSAQASAGDVAEPSRESMITHMHALFEALETKLATGVHVFAHEIATLRDHVTKVL